MFTSSSLFEKRPSPLMSISKPRRHFHENHNFASWEWLNPPEHSLPVKYCLDTSLHGLKYLGQKRRHLCERVFWLVAFLAAFITSTVLIVGMWTDYKESPIVTVFNPVEKTLDAIPFPSVTICNVNGLQKSIYQTKLQEAVEKVGNGPVTKITDVVVQKVLALVLDMFQICETTLTFVDRFMGENSLIRVVQIVNEAIQANLDTIQEYVDPLETLKTLSQPCHEMILYCVWLGKVQNCSELFQPIDTDYGYCCTFNTIPVGLLIQDPEHELVTNDTVYQSWKEANLDYESLLFTEDTANRSYPYRQKYPGRSAGLSVLLNPDLDEYFCTNTDSEGFILGINVPLDFPRMKDNGIALRTDSEIYVSVRPEITMSDKSIKSFSLDKRQCYFGGEYKLAYYTKYTTSNCMNECVANRTYATCNCYRYYMPRKNRINMKLVLAILPIMFFLTCDDDTKLCKPHNYNCTDTVETWIIEFGISVFCKQCLPVCTDIDYRREVSTLKLQRKRLESMFEAQSVSEPPQNVSLVHIYLDTDSVTPKLRKEFSSKTQILSNAGGLLGLCMGFSVLSLLEIFYYGTIRICCRYYRSTFNDQENPQNEDSAIAANSESLRANLYGPKRSWIRRILNKSPAIEERHSIIKDTRSETSQTSHARLELNTPLYFKGSLEEQFHDAFLATFPDGRGYTYPPYEPPIK